MFKRLQVKKPTVVAIQSVETPSAAAMSFDEREAEIDSLNAQLKVIKDRYAAMSPTTDIDERLSRLSAKAAEVEPLLNKLTKLLNKAA